MGCGVIKRTRKERTGPDPVKVLAGRSPVSLRGVSVEIYMTKKSVTESSKESRNKIGDEKRSPPYQFEVFEKSLDCG